MIQGKALRRQMVIVAILGATAIGIAIVFALVWIPTRSRPLWNPRLGEELSTVPGVSIKRSFSGDGTMGFSPGEFEAENMTLRKVIESGIFVPPGFVIYEVDMPPYAFNVSARPSDPRSPESVQALLGRAFEESLGISLQKGVRRVPGFRLTVSDPSVIQFGPAPQAQRAPSKRGDETVNVAEFEGTSSSLSELLRNHLCAPVVDEAGITRSFHLNIRSIRASPQAFVDSLAAGGFVLTPSEISCEVLVVSSAR